VLPKEGIHPLLVRCIIILPSKGFVNGFLHPSSQGVDRAFYAFAPPIQNVRVDHRGSHVVMPKEFLVRASLSRGHKNWAEDQGRRSPRGPVLTFDFSTLSPDLDLPSAARLPLDRPPHRRRPHLPKTWPHSARPPGSPLIIPQKSFLRNPRSKVFCPGAAHGGPFLTETRFVRRGSSDRASLGTSSDVGLFHAPCPLPF
jgi:hypothetical protein